MLIASYADLKRCLESVYQDLLVRVFIISSLNTFTIGVDSAIMDEVIDKRFLHDSEMQHVRVVSGPFFLFKFVLKIWKPRELSSYSKFQMSRSCEMVR